jgi:hypothetical protein
MAWNFILLFHLLFFILSLLPVIYAYIHYIGKALVTIVGLSVANQLKDVILLFTGKSLFLRGITSVHINHVEKSQIRCEGEKAYYIKNRKLYAIFIYFQFFAGKIDSFKKVRQ